MSVSDDRLLASAFAVRAIERVGLELKDRGLALDVARLLTGMTCSRSGVLADVWAAKSPAAAERALNRLRRRIAAASLASGWPLRLDVLGRGDDRRLAFVGRVPEYHRQGNGLRVVMGCVPHTLLVGFMS